MRSASAKEIVADIVLCDEEGRAAADIRGLRLASLPAAQDNLTGQLQEWTYFLEWEKTEVVPAFADPARWIVFSGGGGLAAIVSEQLSANGAAEVVEVAAGAAFERLGPDRFVIRRDQKDDIRGIFAAIDLSTCRGVIDARGVDAPSASGDPAGCQSTLEGLYLMQVLAESVTTSPPRFYLVTQGAQQVKPDEPVAGLDHAALIGLVRVAACEYAELRCTSIDADPDLGPEAGRWVALEILADSNEEDVALRGVDRYRRRLVRASVERLDDAAAERRLLRAEDGRPFTLEVGTRGVLDSLRYREMTRRAPTGGEVEVEVRAAALNFKDVLKVLGLLPAAATDHTFHGERLGMEAAGVVTRLGEGVTEYQLGDAVIAPVQSCFSSHVTVPTSSLFAVSSDVVNPMEAAGVPVAFVTAYYALHRVAQLAPGETVLIHAATGGVGLAAIQVARWLGAEIYATAGSPEKREYLRGLGVRHIWDSRTPEFADGILALTEGRGVDVVLNSLSGEAFQKSLSIMAPFGRFIEIGKRDIIENSRLPLLPFNRNLNFTAIDLDKMMAERPHLVRQLLREVQERLEARDFSPVPVTVFPGAQVSAAFRHMAQARHIGKIVLDFTDVRGLTILPGDERERLFAPDATYLVTGGFGGVGLELASWMASQGAKHLALVGRRGPATDEARAIVERLRADGVAVRVCEADVSEEADVNRLLADVAREMPPLRGVFHAAAVLDDGLIAQLDAERLARVMAPKARGAWLLHAHTQTLPLDYFVLFSSATAWIGNPGQANYVAANTYLDALADHRRACGLPATSISWGAFADVGMVATAAHTSEHLARVGIRPLRPALAMKALGRILRWNPRAIAVVDVQWGKLRQAHPTANTCPRLATVLAEAESSSVAATGDVRALLKAVPPHERLERLTAGIVSLVADALRMPPETIDINRPLTQLGIDSLIGMELQAAVRIKLGIEVSILQWMKGGTIAGTAVQILERFNIPYAAAAGDDDAVAVDEATGFRTVNAAAALDAVTASSP